MADQELPPVKVAFIIDDTVVDILHTDQRLAAIFLSEPLIIDVSEFYDPELLKPNVTKYDPKTGKLYTPEEE